MKYQPNNRQKMQIVLNDFQTFGPWRAIKHLLIYSLTRSETFDKRYEVATHGHASDADLETPEDLDFANYSGPVSENVMNDILQEFAAAANPRNYTFVDLGCGKGRALLITSRLPFQEIIGVEVSPFHQNAAQKNIDRYLERAQSKRPGAPSVACSRIRACCSDANEFQLPASNLLVFMNNPFQGATFRGVLDRLCSFQRRTQHRVWVALALPISEFHLRRRPEFRLHEERQHIFFGNSWNLWECQAQPELKLASGK